MFRALLAHPQEVLHNSTWYVACVLYQLAAPGLKWGTVNKTLSIIDIYFILFLQITCYLRVQQVFLM
jgi:hypothetical protein